MKKKKTLLIIVIVLLVIIGVFVYLYTKTDYLKTNQQLFWKYAVQNSEITELFNNEDIEELKNKKVNSSYTINSNFDVKVKNETFAVTSKTSAKNSNDIITSVDFSKNSNSIIDFNLVKKSNVVGLKMDELANGYITLKNSNLKELAQKIGIEETGKIPDNINWGTYIDLLEISEQDTEYITEKYMNLIVADTELKNYKNDGSVGVKINDKIHTANSYKISLTENESKKILSDIFVNLSEDSRTLNLISSKLKILNLPSEYTQISNISNKFLEISNNIKSIDTTDDEFIEITIYVENSKLIQTNIKIGQDKLIKVVYDKDNNTIDIKQELLNDNTIDNKFILSISDALNKICNMVQEVKIVNEISEDNTMLSTKVDIYCKDDIDINYKSVTQISDTVEVNSDYENSNKIILNELTEKQLKNLYKAIIESVPSIYQNIKSNLINENTSSNSDNVLNEDTSNNSDDASNEDESSNSDNVSNEDTSNDSDEVSNENEY